MHQFLHGIRRSVLEALGLPCLPFSLLFRDGADEGEEDGCLLPQPSGDDDVGCLVPKSSGEQEAGCLLPNGVDEEGDLLPAKGAEYEGNTLPANGEEDGALPPQRGAIQGALQPMQSGEEEEDDAAVNNLHKHEGVLPPKKSDVYDGILPSNTSNLYIWYACAIHINMQDVVHYARQQHHCKFFHAINAWLMPSSRPRVKMKANLQQHDAHAWKHDAWASSSSPSDSSIPIHLADAKVFQAYQRSLPFTPLRGRNRCQAREMKDDEVSTGSKPKTKTKIMLMQMRLSYITKDVLDPG